MAMLERRFVKKFLAIVALVLVTGATVAARNLRPETLAGWAAYIGATERRVERELASADRFLAQDFVADVAGKREALRRGTILIESVDAAGARGEAIEVPSALVHHWRGAVFIPGAKLSDLLAKLQAGVPASEDVLASRVLERGPD